MNYFRSRIVQQIAGTFVVATLLFAVTVPISQAGRFAKDRAAVQLFGESLDVPVDVVFLSTWRAALHSDAETLDGFVEVFVRSYERANGIASGSLSKDAHTLWSILEGISLNIDPWGLATALSASLKSTTVAATTKLAGSIASTSDDCLAATGFRSVLSHCSRNIFVRSILTAINPQGP